jgi:HEAT repeats
MRTILLLLVASAAYSQNLQPTVVNAQFSARPYAGPLEHQLRAASSTSSPAWIGYAVKGRSKGHQSCCWNGSAQCGCSLEDHAAHSAVQASSSPIPLEGSDAIAILYRVSNGVIEKLQIFSILCPLDAGGLPFIWVTGVPQQASVSFLEQILTANATNGLIDGALVALSQHDGPEALNALIGAARDSASPHLRGQALFWLAQRAGERASATITNAIQNDPDAGVKKKAVFALSQLPPDEAIPKLIEVARTQRNPEVRKQAFFWLGQSRDPRAFVFIQDVLTRP